MLENLITGSQFHILDNSSLGAFIYVSKIASLVLALVVMVYAYQFYKIYRSIVLSGIILGFGFMALADVFMILALPVLNDPISFNLFFWLRLSTVTYGLTFLALAYFRSTREGGNMDTFVLKITGLSVIPVFAFLTLSWFSNNSSLPPFTNYDEYFRVYHICAMGYIFIKSFQYSNSHVRKDFMYLPLAYGIFWMGGFSILFFTLDGSTSALVGAFVAKDVGLVILVMMMYWINKGKPSLKAEIKTPDEI